MKILGIESSCDETAASVVEDGQRLLSNVVHSQIDIHAQYGGVVPEIAARSHIEVINPVIEKALLDAACSWDDIDAIAVTYAPGLVGSLLVGTLAARTLAVLHDKPLYAVHHVEGHVYANFIIRQGLASQRDNKTKAVLAHDAQKPSLQLPREQPKFPMLALIVSGKHSELVLFKGHGDYRLLGETQDDAVGEAYDKVAKILGLPYPGGPSVEKAAVTGDPQAYSLPYAKLHNPYDFSFSGLKTAVLRAVQRETGVDHQYPSYKLSERLVEGQRADFAASFVHTATQTLVRATVRAYDEFQPASVVIAGGVAASRALRQQLTAALPASLAIEYAPIQLCTDNAAMIATLAYYMAQVCPPHDPYALGVVPSLSLVGSEWASSVSSS